MKNNYFTNKNLHGYSESEIADMNSRLDVAMDNYSVSISAEEYREALLTEAWTILTWFNSENKPIEPGTPGLADAGLEAMDRADGKGSRNGK